MPRPAVALRTLIAIHFVWTFLLTPIAFEPRPFSSFTVLGFGSLALIFTTVALDIAAFVLATRRPRTAGLAASIGAVLFIPAFLIDRAGLFSSESAPATIVILEAAALVTQVLILWSGYRLRTAKGS